MSLVRECFRGTIPAHLWASPRVRHSISYVSLSRRPTCRFRDYWMSKISQPWNPGQPSRV